MAVDTENYKKHTNLLLCQNAFILVLKLMAFLKEAVLGN
jgi:hypothetical protein